MPLLDAIRTMTVLEASNRLSVSTDKIWDLIRDGRLASLKVGHRRVIRVEALEAFVLQAEADAAAASMATRAAR